MENIAADISQKRNSHFPIVMIVILVGVFIGVITFLIYLIFFYQNIQFSPDEETGFSYENARTLLVALGQEGIDWYCEKTDSFTDSQGDVYGQKELKELKRVLGNEEELQNEFC